MASCPWLVSVAVPSGALAPAQGGGETLIVRTVSAKATRGAARSRRNRRRSEQLSAGRGGGRRALPQAELRASD
jgi:hypothetical protein